MNYAVILSTLEPRDVILLTKQSVDRVGDNLYSVFPSSPRLAIVRFGISVISKISETS